MKQRLYQIDFLKFIFALMIVYYHLMGFLVKQYPDVLVYTKLQLRSGAVGSNIVFAFFILSGYFLCKAALSKPIDILSYIKNRIVRLWPLLAFSFITFIFIGSFNVYDFLNIFFISNGIGIVKSSSHNAATWFICVLFWQSILFYYLLVHYKEKFLPFCGFFVLFSFVWLTYSPNGGLYSAIALPSLQLTTGMVRGIGGISLGIILFYIIPFLKKDKKLNNKIILSISEIVLLYLIVHYLCDHKVICYEIFYQIILLSLF